jgi:intein-encoded DNA endonuclease-like protein
MRVPQETWDTPSLLSRTSDLAKLDYVRGFWDAEGGLPQTTKQTYISFDQKNRCALEFIRNILSTAGFHPTNITLTGQCWQFRITRKNELARYFREIGTSHPEKHGRFRKMLKALFP